MAGLAQARAASRPGLCAIAPGRRAEAPLLWQLARSFPVTGLQPLSSLQRAGNRASMPGHRALARSSLLRDWFSRAGAVLSLAQTHRGRPQTTSTRLYAGGEVQGSAVWQALSRHQGGILWMCSCLPSQGHWDPDSLCAALNLGGQATVW